jgi:16S rRNA (guanine966-N2)-methyltransferase
VVQVENNPQACQKLRDNSAALKADQIEMVCSDVDSFLQRKAESFDLVFLDPPFGQNLIAQICRLLEQGGWLSGYAKIYVEAERNLTLVDMPSNWRQLKGNAAGEVGFYLFQRQA